MTIQELHENTIDLCSRLIQAKSYSGEEREVVGVIEREMRRLGYDEVTARAFHRDMTYYSYGLAILANTGHLALTETELREARN